MKQPQKKTVTPNAPAKKKMSVWQNLTHRRSFRHGSLAVALSAIVIALVLVVNILFGLLATNFRWYVDMTGQGEGLGLYTISEPTIAAVEAVKDTTRYEIIFCAEEDMVKANDMGKYVWHCADAFAQKTENLELRYLDVANPNDMEYFRVDSSPSATTVIVAAYDKDAQVGAQPNSFRRLNYNSFFTSDPQTGKIFAFDGEYKLAVTLLGLSSTKPQVYFTTGHGEDNGEESGLYQLFLDAGYVVSVVDLTRDALTAESGVLVINQPKKDIGAYKDDREGPDGPVAGDEAYKIEKFLNEKRGSIMVFADFVEYSLPNLQEVIAQRGIGVYTQGYVKDSSSLTEDGFSILAKYPTNENNVSYELLPSNDNIYTIVPNACGLYRSAVSGTAIAESDDFEWTDGGGRVHVTSPVLLSGDRATIAGENQKQHALMMMTVTNHYPSEAGDASEWTDVETHSFAVVCGSAEYAKSVLLNSNHYYNRDILYNMLLSISSKSGSLKNLPADTELKLLSDESLNISVKQADAWTVVCVAILPAIATVCGIVVYVRRKHL